jgi:zinc D-Ala-D-Ala carboxypeptidase
MIQSKYFKEYEWECQCDCGESHVRASSLLKLDDARGIAGIPFLINSGCRCELHNLRIGGSPTSSHIASEDKPSCAFDIAVPNSHARYVILSALIKAGFTRIGIAKTFIHVDDDETKPPHVTWLYS